MPGGTEYFTGLPMMAKYARASPNEAAINANIMETPDPITDHAKIFLATMFTLHYIAYSNSFILCEV